METLPGGLLAHLASAGTAETTAVRASCAVGDYAAALGELDRTAARGTTGAVWRSLAWDGVWLTLPDETNRPMAQLGTKLLERPPAAEIEPPIEVPDWILCPLLTDLRNIRSVLSPDLRATEPALVADAFRDGLDAIDQARTALAARPDLLGHLDLLAADLAVRAGESSLVEEFLRSADQRLTAAGDVAGRGAAALVAGDRLAAPLTSPVSWNCVLAHTADTADNALPDEVEAAEFTGSGADPAGAEAAYAEAARCYADANDQAGRAAVALRRGYLAVIAGEPSEAIEFAELARLEFEAAGRPMDAAVAAVHRALAAIAGDRFPADLGAADVVKAVGLGTAGHAAAFGLGLLCVRVGRHWAGVPQPERARATFRLAERIWAAIDEPWLRARTLADVAQSAVSVGDFTAARVALLDALAADPTPLAEPADPFDGRRVGRAFLAGRMYNMASEIMDVEGMDRASWVIHETLDPLRAILPTLSDLGKVFATQLLELTNLPGRTVATLLYRARDAADDGDTERAAFLFAEARAVLEATAVEERGIDEALVLAYEGDKAGASDAFERYVEAKVMTSDPAEVRMLHRQGLAFQLNVENTIRARHHYEVLVTSGTPWWTGLGPHWQALAAEGRLLEQENDLAAAAAALDQSLSEIELTRATLRSDASKRSFFAGRDVQQTYLDATRVVVRLRENAQSAGDDDAARNHGATAFAYVERGRARALLDLMMSATGAERAGLPGGLVDRWRSTGAAVALAQDALVRASERETPAVELAQLRRQLDAAIEALRLVEEELQLSNPRFWDAVNPQADVSTLDVVAATLPVDTALVQFAMGRTDLFSWVVTREGMIASSRFSGQHDVKALVRTIVEAAAHRTGHGDSADRLAALLLTPVRDAIRNCTSLFIAPAGALMRLPFAVLPWEGSVLGAGFPIVVTPSASALEAPTAPFVDAGPVVVVGDPADMAIDLVPGRPPVPLDPLPGARLEATCVARLYPGAELLLGPDATEDRIRPLLSRAPVAHLATHGVLDTDSPLGSAVLLAAGAALTTADLVGERLGHGLVVMSACHTGEGNVLRGDELLGLSRALFAAGARSAVVTLWAVDDRSAALLMTEFHRRLRAGDTEPQALRAASNYLRGLDRAAALAAFEALRQADPGVTPGPDGTGRGFGPWSPDPLPFSHPYHWAPFALISTG
ncbi:CHAT domain-containing protein [Amycolatopsis sp. lyj-109]|uniref:CHAT domain-containing protein n=1 Tax=Amycolatopsis sp. lyj-109 TaxID=2789287 RepID=UPI00397AD566